MFIISLECRNIHTKKQKKYERCFNQLRHEKLNSENFL